MKKLVLTGASGFIGRGILEELVKENRYEIYALTTTKNKLIEFEKSVHVCELNVLDDVETNKFIGSIKPDCLIHMAWSLSGNDEFQNSDMNDVWADASKKLFDSFYANGGKRVIFAGSSSEYANDDHAWKEDESCIPYNHYGECKRGVTEYGMDAVQKSGQSFLTARFFSVYGKYDLRPGRAIPSCIDSFLHDKEIVCNSPYNKWDYIYIEDAAKIVCRLVESDVSGQINVASGKPVFMKEVFEEIAFQLGKENLLSVNKNQKETVCLYADNTKLKKETGYESFVDIKEGIAKTIEWYRNK